MATARQLARALRRHAWPRRRSRYYGDPAQYWEARHQATSGGLDGVGLQGLGEAGNRLDYGEKWSQLEAVLRPLLRNDHETLLDAGCGIGFFGSRAANLGFDVLGVDFSESAIAQARSMYPTVEWRTGSLTSMGLSGREFDVVLCVDVLFHVTDRATWVASLSSLASHVATRGSLIIQEHLVVDSGDKSAQTSEHVRWRTVSDYLVALHDWHLEQHVTYVLPAQGTTKDVLHFRRT
jgi:SAM-dependent methyltransferase